MHTTTVRFDYLLVGGGLSNALIALAIFQRQPGARVGLVEAGPALGGNHLWCFHAGDLDGEAERYVESLVTNRWPRYDVRFPGLRRTLEEPYAAVTSTRLDEAVRAAFQQQPGSRLFLGERAVSIERELVQLASGVELWGRVVLDSRGPEAFPSQGGGYQKFLGLELELSRPSGIAHPVLMDALVPQRDGFRFLYVLPLASDRVLLEDTYFSDTPELDPEHSEREIMAYARENGLQGSRVVRRETGVLPLPTRFLRPDFELSEGPLVAGYQGGWFHPVTGYSFPVAVRVASAVAACEPETLRQHIWPALLREQYRQLSFGLLLNRLFFGAFAPEQRYRAIERFYRLPPAAVRRFYAMALTRSDRARILCGRPPRGFSFSRALTTGAFMRGASS